MALFLAFASEQNHKGSSGRNAALVSAANAGAALAAVEAAALDGGIGDVSSWSTLQLASSAHADFSTAAPDGVVWIGGEIAEPLMPHRSI
jgi:hypothetical protein